MAFNFNDFDPAAHQSAQYEPLPEGKYLAVISETETKQTKDGTGSYLQLKLVIVEGPCKNRTLFDRLNLENKNEIAVKIAKATLGDISRAFGIIPKSPSDLHNKPLKIKVKIKPADGRFEESNEIRGYYSAKDEPIKPTTGTEKKSWEM